MPRKRGIRSSLRREFRVVRATALRKLRTSKVDLSLNELEVLAQQIRADLDRIDGDGTGTASSSYTAGATAHGCHGGHGQATHAGNPTERSTAGGDERNLDGSQREGIETGSRPVRVIRSKDSPQGATLRRATDVVKNLRVPMESLLQDRKYRELLDKIDDPTKDVGNGDLDLENQELSMQLYFALVLVMQRESVGRVDREKRKPRRRCRGMETDSGRVCLDRAGKRSRHVVQVGRSSVPSGLRHCGRPQQDGRGHDQVPEDDWGKSVQHHQERHPHEGADKRSRANRSTFFATAHASARTRRCGKR